MEIGFFDFVAVDFYDGSQGASRNMEICGVSVDTVTGLNGYGGDSDLVGPAARSSGFVWQKDFFSVLDHGSTSNYLCRSNIRHYFASHPL